MSLFDKAQVPGKEAALGEYASHVSKRTSFSVGRFSEKDLSDILQPPFFNLSNDNWYIPMRDIELAGRYKEFLQ